jgi:hypothetical protein
MASSKQGDGRDRGNPPRHTGRGFASMDPERQREIAGHDTLAPERAGASETEDDPAPEPAGKAGAPAGAQRGTPAGGNAASAAGAKGGRQGSGGH